jgi:uncharacterized alpha-E superfamily protein
MLSRIADSLYWLNRYIERSDTVLRLVYVHYILSLDRSVYNVSSGWRPVLQICTACSEEEMKVLENNAAATLQKILFDEKNANSICNMVSRARENARGAQDHLTKEVWKVVNQMYHMANDSRFAEQLENDQAIKIMEDFAQSTVLFAGITDTTMWRGLGWNFMQLGKYMERCQQSIAIIQRQLEDFDDWDNDAGDILKWRHLLLCLSGFEMHLKMYRSHDHTSNVLQQLFLDENFTRSVIYSLLRINYYVENIMSIHEDGNKELVRNFGRLFSKVKYMDLQSMDRAALCSFLQEINKDLMKFSTMLAQYYFSYT